jgi:hypothetical protein
MRVFVPNADLRTVKELFKQCGAYWITYTTGHSTGNLPGHCGYLVTSLPEGDTSRYVRGQYVGGIDLLEDKQ